MIFLLTTPYVLYVHFICQDYKINKSEIVSILLCYISIVSVCYSDDIATTFIVTKRSIAIVVTITVRLLRHKRKQQLRHVVVAAAGSRPKRISSTSQLLHPE